MKRQRQPARCGCGHDRDAHTHYRAGTDCALCACQRWAPPRWWRLRAFWPGRPGLLDSVHVMLSSMTDIGIPGRPAVRIICSLRCFWP